MLNLLPENRLKIQFDTRSAVQIETSTDILRYLSETLRAIEEIGDKSRVEVIEVRQGSWWAEILIIVGTGLAGAGVIANSVGALSREINDGNTPFAKAVAALADEGDAEVCEIISSASVIEIPKRQISALGVQYLKSGKGLYLPKGLDVEFTSKYRKIQTKLENFEVSPANAWRAFEQAYFLDDSGPLRLIHYKEDRETDGTRVFTGEIAFKDVVQSVSGRGNGLVSSVVTTLEEAFELDFKVLDYTEHALGKGRNARAAAYLKCQSGDRVIWGCGIDEDVATASVRAVLSAANSVVAD